MSTSIRAEGVSKKYSIGRELTRITLRDELQHHASDLARRVNPFRSRRANRPADSDQEFWALRDVSFEVPQGQRLGIIGRNGAGKSTLLKILSRITEPTTGRIALRGRVASLLEVGTGFHPELSGRENIFLNGAILGMSMSEITRKFTEIVEFAEIEQFLDTPVKRYSSGMYVRLAFAVAAHLEPEILIVDEVLAVGDHRFQRKCLGKMAQVGRSGRTIVFVSHNMNAVSSLCNQVIWIDQGRVASCRPPREAISEYLNHGCADVSRWTPAGTGGSFFYDKVEVFSESSAEGQLPPDSAIHIEFSYTVSKMLPPGRLAFTLANEEGLVVLASASTDAEGETTTPWRLGPATVRCTIGPHLLMPGRYFLSVSAPGETGDTIHDRVLSFRVSEVGSLAARDGRGGVVAPVLRWATQQ